MGALSTILKPKTLIPAGAGVFDYLQRRSATKNAVNTLRTGAQNASAIFDPYRKTGEQGLTTLRALTNPETALATLEQTPGYSARLREGERSIQRSAAAKGTLLSGGTLKALTRYGQDYAANALNEEFGRNLSLADMGLAAGSEQARLEQEIANALANGDFEKADELSKLIGIGADVATGLFTKTAPGGVTGTASVTGGLTKAGLAVGKAAGTAGKVVAGGVKAGLGALASNPVGWAALGGAGILALGKTVFGWGNTHKYANKLTAANGPQGVFGGEMEQIDQIGTEQGWTREQKLEALSESLRNTAQAAVDFARQGKDQTKVVSQWFSDFSGPDWQRDWPELASIVAPYQAQLGMRTGVGALSGRLKHPLAERSA